MSMLRRILQVKSINHTARAIGRVLMPSASYQRFDRRLPLVDPFDFPMPNGTVIHWRPYGDRVSKFLRYDGWDGYESSSVRLFYKLAQEARVIFDVGAYLGYFGVVAAAARAGNQVFSFEAVPGWAERCKEIVALNSTLNIEVVGAAVGKVDGTLNIYLDRELVTDASTDPSFRGDRVPLAVPALRLDSFVAQRSLQSLDLLKIDTETTEPDVLEGMAETIGRFRPTFLIEVLPLAHLSALEEFLARNDYKAAHVSVAGPVAKSKLEPSDNVEEYNYLFYPASATNAVSEAAHRLVG